MRKPDWWNWPPFMTVLRHNREITILAEQYQEVVGQEHARATREGRAQVHAFAREATWNIFYGDSGGGTTNPRAYVALQQAEHMFSPEQTNVKEATDRATATA